MLTCAPACMLLLLFPLSQARSRWRHTSSWYKARQSGKSTLTSPQRVRMTQGACSALLCLDCLSAWGRSAACCDLPVVALIACIFLLFARALQTSFMHFGGLFMVHAEPHASLLLVGVAVVLCADTAAAVLPFVLTPCLLQTSCCRQNCVKRRSNRH
jgi:hypothetical protein